MKQVNSKMGVSEALIYKYFETKENLLYACFESFHMRVAALFRNFTLPPITSPQDMYAAIRALWFTYFEFLVNGDYRTIYSFDYRYKGVDALAASGVDLLFVAKCKEEDIYQVQRDLNRELKLMFDENNINVPFPRLVFGMRRNFFGI